MDRHLSPQEVARRFGVSIKALRLYERHGLLTPQRSEAGWRVYGPGQLARLHQIIALKRMGLSLARIGEILGSADQLDDILAIQEQSLDRDSQRISHALMLVAAARAKLKRGQALSIDDLVNLNTETVMPSKPTKEEFKALVTPILARHLTPEQIAGMKARRAQLDEQWEILKPEAEAAMATGDPASPAARHVAERLRVIRRAVLGGDSNPDMAARLKAFKAEAMTDPGLAQVLTTTMTPEMADFLRKAVALLD
jgi:DNA-binding transcriptional MerR regulator